MSTTYIAVTRIKFSNEKPELTRGDVVTAKIVGGQEALNELIESESVMDEERFDILFPEEVEEEGANQPTGTPSNLGDIDGTDLAAPDPDPEPATLPAEVKEASAK
jgi:hypothetical protein